MEAPVFVNRRGERLTRGGVLAKRRLTVVASPSMNRTSSSVSKPSDTARLTVCSADTVSETT